jgi:para-nitrobenzyl esterase
MRLLSSTTLSALAATTLASAPSITIDAGTLNGGKCSAGQDAVFYKGIPFAEPPVGELRFEPPKAYSGNYPNGVHNATASAPACIQFSGSTSPPGAKSEDWYAIHYIKPDKRLPLTHHLTRQPLLGRLGSIQCDQGFEAPC